MTTLTALPSDIWVLLTQASGDNDQCLALAEALDAPFLVKRLDWHVLDASEDRAIVRDLLADAPHAERWRRSLGLHAPWPRMVVCCGRRSDRIGFWIKQQSGGQTKVVSIGRARRAVEAYDLLLAPPQFAVPRRSNVIPLPLPLARRRPHHDDPGAHQTNAHSNIVPVPKPWFTILLGGEVKQFAATRRTLSEAARLAQLAADRHGGSVVVSSSRRTPPELLAALEGMLHRPHVHRWSSSNAAENPYDALLHQSAALFVTADSASMILDGCASGTPTYVIEYPERFDFVRRWRRSAFRAMQWVISQCRRGLPRTGDRLSWIQDWLHARRILRYPRDMRLFHASVYSLGLARPVTDFDPAILPERRVANDLTEASGLPDVVARCRALA